MAKQPQLYVCENVDACSLGTVGQLGRFTGGMTAEQKHLLTGRPFDSLEKGVDYGEGICPNCGTPGEEWHAGKALELALAEAEEEHQARIKALKAEGVK